MVAEPQPATQATAATPDASRLPHGEDNLTPLAQLRRMQHVLYVGATKPGVDNREAAALACAWDRLEERKRVMIMRPAPKPIDVPDPRRGKRGAPRGPGRTITLAPIDQIPAATQAQDPAADPKPARLNSCSICSKTVAPN